MGARERVSAYLGKTVFRDTCCWEARAQVRACNNYANDNGTPTRQLKIKRCRTLWTCTWAENKWFQCTTSNTL